MVWVMGRWSQVGLRVWSRGGDVCKEEATGESEEAEDMCGLRTPYSPIKTEVEDHELTHYSLRVWCVHCVRTRGK